MNVLTVLDLGESARRRQRFAPIYCASTHTYRGVESVPGRQNPPVKQFLGGAGGSLNPIEAFRGIEILRALHNTNGRVVHIRDQMKQKITARTEIRIQNHDVVTGRPGERVL